MRGAFHRIRSFVTAHCSPLKAGQVLSDRTFDELAKRALAECAMRMPAIAVIEPGGQLPDDAGDAGTQDDPGVATLERADERPSHGRFSAGFRRAWSV